MEKIATDIYTFEKIRKNGFTYVDETAALYAMASGDVGNQFFIGVSTQGEVETNDGRIDLVAKTPNDIYIIEFKLDKLASEAMAQIKGNEYAGKYALSGKRITLIGISFSSEKRAIVEELVESC